MPEGRFYSFTISIAIYHHKSLLSISLYLPYPPSPSSLYVEMVSRAGQRASDGPRSFTRPRQDDTNSQMRRLKWGLRCLIHTTLIYEC